MQVKVDIAIGFVSVLLNKGMTAAARVQRSSVPIAWG